LLEHIRNLPHGQRAHIAAATLALAAVIGSLSYKYNVFWLFERPASFVPDLAAGLVAFFIVLPLLRGNLLHSERLDYVTGLCLLLLFYLVSIVVKMGLRGSNPIGILTESPTFMLVVLIVAAANFNAHRYGEIALLAVVPIGGFNIYSVSKVMGFWGWTFIVLFAIGAMLTLDLSKIIPSRSTRRSSREE
jgi:hypothetical protein